MFTFFDLPMVVALAEHAYTTCGEDHAALAWRLAGAPVLSAHPADPDKPELHVVDDRWFSSRWPQLEVGDVTANPLIHSHYTSELFPLTDTDQMLAALRRGLAAGWALLLIDMDETEVSWYLARSRRKKDPKTLLGQRERRPAHPLLQALAAAGFFTRNFPPGSDHWTASKWGPRYHVSFGVDPDTIEVHCLPATLRDPATPWWGRLRADIPTGIAAAIAVAIARIGASDQPTPPATSKPTE